MFHLRTALSRACLLTACWWAMLEHEAAAEKLGDVHRPRGHQLRYARSTVLAPVLLQRAETQKYNPFHGLFGGGQKTAEDPERKKRVMGAINQFRAKMCADMHDEHGEDFKSYESCLAFMEKVCHPGNDMKMDGDRRERTSGKGYCHEFFPEAEAKAEAQIAEEDRKAEESGGILPEAITDALPEAIGGTPAEEKKKKTGGAPAASPSDSGDVSTGSAPAAGPASAPSPALVTGKDGAAPASAPAGAGKNGAAAGGASPAPAGAPGGAPGGAPAYPADQAWYYKDDGKNMKSRLGHMDGSRGLPAQGYWGKLVGHQDMETSVGDWQSEFGGGSYAEHWKAICAKHPESPWCPAHKSPDSSNYWHSGSFARTPLDGLLLLLAMAIVGYY